MRRSRCADQEVEGRVQKAPRSSELTAVVLKKERLREESHEEEETEGGMEKKGRHLQTEKTQKKEKGTSKCEGKELQEESAGREQQNSRSRGDKKIVREARATGGEEETNEDQARNAMCDRRTALYVLAT